MNLITDDNVNGAYHILLRRLLDAPIVSPRGNMTRELSPCTVEITDISRNLITIPGLETRQAYAEAEFKWYMSGSNKIKDIVPYEKVWLQLSDDGKTVNSAYGRQIFSGKMTNGINQYEWVKNKLLCDPDSRQAVININLPAYKEKPTKDFPCTIALQYLIRNNCLDAITYMRSNDAYLGFRNDFYCFTELQKLMASSLDVKTGKYCHIAGSMHLYEKNVPMVENALSSFKK